MLSSPLWLTYEGQSSYTMLVGHWLNQWKLGKDFFFLFLFSFVWSFLQSENISDGARRLLSFILIMTHSFQAQFLEVVRHLGECHNRRGKGWEEHSYLISLGFGFAHCCCRPLRRWMAWSLWCNLHQKVEKAPLMFCLFQWRTCCFACSICTRPAHIERVGVICCSNWCPRFGVCSFLSLGTS